MVKKGRWRMELMAGNMSMLKVFQKKLLKVLLKKNIEGIASI